MAAPYPQVVLFGDSLFEHAVEPQDGFSFVAALQKHCSRRYDVFNRGFSGYNTSQAVQILDRVFTKPESGGPQLKYLLVFLGANDSSVHRDTDNQHVDLETYKTYLRRIITHPHIVAHHPKILLITPPPCDEIRTAELDIPRWGHNTHLSAQTAQYAQGAREVAAQVKGNEKQTEGPEVVLVDYNKALLEYAEARTPGWKAGESEGGLLGSVASGQRGHLENLLPDGLHLSGEAYQVLWGLVKKEIEVPSEGAEGYVWPTWGKAERVKE